MPSIFLLISILLSTLAFQTNVGAEILLPSGEVSDFIPKEKEFDEIRKQYEDFNYTGAIHLAETLKKQRENKNIAKKAAFLLGDIYLDIAEHGRPINYKMALLYSVSSSVHSG